MGNRFSGGEHPNRAQQPWDCMPDSHRGCSECQPFCHRTRAVHPSPVNSSFCLTTVDMCIPIGRAGTAARNPAISPPMRCRALRLPGIGARRCEPPSVSVSRTASAGSMDATHRPGSSGMRRGAQLIAARGSAKGLTSCSTAVTSRIPNGMAGMSWLNAMRKLA